MIDNQAQSIVRLTLIPIDAMKALVARDLPLACSIMNMDLPQFFLDEQWLWNIRIDQIQQDPDSAAWLVRAIQRTTDDQVIGHAGYHGPPDEHGMVEIGYSILPEFRRQGYGRATALQLIADAIQSGRVNKLRASISPTNDASLKLIAPLGFDRVGEQWDEEDGLEIVFERTIQR